MKLFVLTAAALVALVGFARAAEPPQFFLKPDGTVEQRVAVVESDIAALKREVAALKEQLRGSPVAAVAAKPAPVAAKSAPAKVRYSVCVNGRCTIYEADAGSPIPFGATLLSGQPFGVSEQLVVSPCPTGGCGDACGCVGVSSSSGGWYPGKLLGRRR